MISPRTTLQILAMALLIGACKSEPKADLIVTNATIWTGVEGLPLQEAMAIGGDRILAVGTSVEMDAFVAESTTMLDLEGKFVTPGFIDSHVHFMSGGSALSSVQLRDAKTPMEFIQRISDFAKTKPTGTWITGGDWDHQNWGGELPQRAWIDSVTADYPLWINRLDGHMALANSKALELARVSDDVKDVPGGEIIREGGKLTGLLKDNAMSLIGSELMEVSDVLKQMHLKAAMDYFNAHGITSVHDMGTFDDLEQYRAARKDNALSLRIYSCVPISQYQALAEDIQKNGRGDEWLKTGGLKGFVDGSLGSHTAVFLAPYSDLPTDSGIFVSDMGKLEESTRGAIREDLKVAIHAIGDRAIRSLLDMYERILSDNPGKEIRFRIEHAQHLAEADIDRFAEMGIIASMQPYHAIDDGRWAEKLIGSERSAYTYAFKSLLDSGAEVAFGSDWTVAPPSPLEGIYAAATRRTLDGANPDGWVPEQKITVEQALKAYTQKAAYASFDEDKKGVLTAGMLADFVVISDNLLEMDPNLIPQANILQTYVGGRKVFEKTDEK